MEKEFEKLYSIPYLWREVGEDVDTISLMNVKDDVLHEKDIFTTNLGLVWKLSSLAIAEDTKVIDSVYIERNVRNAVEEEAYRDNHYMILDYYAAPLIKSVHREIINLNTGDVMFSYDLRFGLDPTYNLCIYDERGECMDLIRDGYYNLIDYAYDFSSSVWVRSLQPLSAAKNVRVYSKVYKKEIKDLVKEKLMPKIVKDMKVEAYKAVIERLSEDYKYDCHDEGEYTVCVRSKKGYYHYSWTHAVPVKYVTTVVIKKPEQLK